MTPELERRALDIVIQLVELADGCVCCAVTAVRDCAVL